MRARLQIDEFIRRGKAEALVAWRKVAVACSALRARYRARSFREPATSERRPYDANRGARVRRPLDWSIVLPAVALVATGVTSLVLGAIVYFAFSIPIDGGLVNDTKSALIVDASDGSPLAVRGTVQGETLTFEEISPNLKKAIVAIEDRRFYDHGALDLRGFLRAIAHNMWNSHAQGASTISQQLARLMMLSPDRTLHRKVQEALVAIWLEHHLTKSQILARYLDTAYFGAGAYGADAAAQRYFGRSARDLTLSQAAMIAGLVRAPSSLAPRRNLDAAQARAKVVLRSMTETGAITKAEADAAIATPAVLKVAPEMPPGPGYVSDAAAAEVKALVGLGAVDLSTRTTIDPTIQAAAERAIDTQLKNAGESKHVSQAALVAIGAHGEILAMVGGRDYEASTLNRATQTRRQAGSLFKLFVYLAALRNGATPRTMVEDRPLAIGDWQPSNYEDRFGGRMTLASAFAHSVNTVAAQLGQQVGIKTIIKTAQELGVQSPLPDVPSLALGTGNVTLMEMTRAFATIASDQESIEPFLVQRIASHGKPLFTRPPQYGGDADPSADKLAMRELLADVVHDGTGRGARLPFPTGGKTGTTQDYRDAWFIGSAPDITVGVWVGNDDNSPMKGVTGGDIPVKIWRDVVVAAQARLDRQKKTSTPGRTASASRPADEMPKTADADPKATTPETPVPPPVADDAAASGAPADPAAAGAISGEADVVDTASLGVEGHEVRLAGIVPQTGRPARALARFLRRQDVSCTPASGGTFRCSVDGDDLATIILSNGGSEATPDAPPDLLAAQRAAQDGRRGIWRRRR